MLWLKLIHVSKKGHWWYKGPVHQLAYQFSFCTMSHAQNSDEVIKVSISKALFKTDRQLWFYLSAPRITSIKMKTENLEKFKTKQFVLF